MSFIQSQRMYYIDSHNRITGTHSQFSYKIDMPKDKEYTHCCLMSASIPKSYYLIASGYNTFTLNENKSSAIITVPPGNYSATSFKTTLTTLLNTASPNGWIYAIALPNSLTGANTGKFTYTVSGNSGNQPSFTVTTNVYEQLGFDPNTTNNFVGDTLTSINVIKMQLEDTLYIHSDLGSNGSDDILNEIFVSNSVDYSTIKYQCPDVDAYSKELQTINSSVFSFWITNEDSQVMNLNGLNVVFTLLLYRKDPIFKNIKDYIKIRVLETSK